MENDDAIQPDRGGAEPHLVWGIAKIGEAINRTPRQAEYLLARGVIKSAMKKGGRWVAARAALLREFGGG